MPIPRKVLMQCKNCGFKTYRFIGDALPDMNQLKPCPKCNKPFSMEVVEEDSVNNKIIGSLGGVIDMINSK